MLHQLPAGRYLSREEPRSDKIRQPSDLFCHNIGC